MQLHTPCKDADLGDEDKCKLMKQLAHTTDTADAAVILKEMLYAMYTIEACGSMQPCSSSAHHSSYKCT